MEIIYVNASPTHAQGKSTYLHDNIVYGMKSIFECFKSDIFGTFKLTFVDIKIYSVPFLVNPHLENRISIP